jgi:hypothetical protein
VWAPALSPLRCTWLGSPVAVSAVGVSLSPTSETLDVVPDPFQCQPAVFKPKVAQNVGLVATEESQYRESALLVQRDARQRLLDLPIRHIDSNLLETLRGHPLLIMAVLKSVPLLEGSSMDVDIDLERGARLFQVASLLRQLGPVLAWQSTRAKSWSLQSLRSLLLRHVHRRVGSGKHKSGSSSSRDRCIPRRFIPYNKVEGT